MRRRRVASPLNAISLWTQVAAQSTEMLVASAEVITRRTQRMASSGISPDATDRREMQRMLGEKVSASGESMLAMCVGGGRLYLDVCAHLFSMFGPASGRPGSAFASANQAASHSLARMAGDVLEPYRARATSNVKRLRKSRV
jgi:hypothetical protein